MEQFNSYNQTCSELRNLPLVFKKIYHNAVVCRKEEDKLLFIDKRHQSISFCQVGPTRNISKTLPKNKIDNEMLR